MIADLKFQKERLPHKQITFRHYNKIDFNSFKVNKFLDTLLINVRGGKGGQGLERFGGFGGQGGNVYVVGNEKTTLASLKNETLEKQSKLLFKAHNGENSSKNKLLGPYGSNTYVEVPPGVSVKTNQGQYLGEVLEPGEKLLVAKGGDGGRPDNGFVAGKGHFHRIVLDLKLIADIGLVGFPNAGKSSLVKSLSRVNAEIKPYPFTTISPQIGMMMYQDRRQISVADLPGLVEGAHENYGMGHSFLKHMERTKLLLFVVDLHGFQFKTNSPNRTAFETVAILLKEMELAKSELLTKPAVLAFNKTDIPGSDEIIQEVTHKVNNMSDYFQELEEDIRPTVDFKFEDIIFISARKRHNIDILKANLRTYLDKFSDLERTNELEEHNEKALKYLNSKLTEHSSSGTLL